MPLITSSDALISLEQLPYLSSTFFLWLIAGVIILACGYVLLTVKPQESFKLKLMKGAVTGVFLGFTLGIYLPNLIQSSQLEWGFNDEALLLYNQETQALKGFWRWNDLTVELKQGASYLDFHSFYVMELYDRNHQLVHRFQAKQLEDLAHEVKLFAQYHPDFRQQVEQNTSFDTELTTHFLELLDNVVKEQA